MKICDAQPNSTKFDFFAILAKFILPGGTKNGVLFKMKGAKFDFSLNISTYGESHHCQA